jgi:hypothetical protein
MHKHIPTLTLVHYQDQGYAYRYDDKDGNTQEQGMFVTLDSAIGDAVRHLRTFTLLEGIETQN